MSFEGLPTELDSHVLSFLEIPELSAMSMVSKTHRRDTEPYLYRHLVCSTEHCLSVRWLLITMIQRPELAAYIRSITLDQSTFSGKRTCEKAEKAAGCLEGYCQAIQMIINDILGPPRDTADNRLFWFSQALSDDYLEASLTVVICLSTNIESITIASGPSAHGAWVSHVMSMLVQKPQSFVPLPPTAQPSAAQQQIDTKHFTKMRHLVVDTESYFTVFVLPSLEVLSVRCQYFETQILNKCLNLHTMKFIAACESLDEILNPIKDHGTPNLTNLILRKLAFDEHFEYQQLVDALAEYCPKLEHLELGFDTLDQEESDMVLPLKELFRLTSLKSLRIDVALLARQADWHVLFDPAALLPSSLVALHLSEVREDELDAFVKWHVSLRDGLVFDRARSFHKKLPTHSIKEVSITMSCGPRFSEDPDYLEELRIWAAYMHDEHIDFKILRCAEKLEVASKVLIDRNGVYQ